MRLYVTYRDGEPTGIECDLPRRSSVYRFTKEGSTARLVDVRAKEDIEEGTSALELIELNQVHDGVLELPFIDRVTVWMKGRTDTETEKPTSELGES